MTLEEMCIDFDQAKKLKQLGIIQWRSFAKWGLRNGLPVTAPKSVYDLVFSAHPMYTKNESFAAFTGTELGIMLEIPSLALPVYESKLKADSRFCVAVRIETWIKPDRYKCVIYSNEDPNQIYLETRLFRSEVEARAQLLITLLEQQFLHPDTVNQQLLK